jgi:hypothetical protein
MPAEVVTQSGKPKREPISALTPSLNHKSFSVAKLDPATYVGNPAVGTSKAAPAVGIPFIGPKDTELAASDAASSGAVSQLSSQAGSLHFFGFSFHACCLSQLLFSRSDTPVTTAWESTRSGYRNTVSGLTGILIVCSSFMRVVPIWVARLTGNRRKINSKCPCHDSGYDSEGINFEGPAPRPHGSCSHRDGAGWPNVG